jgi:hypothetical protein
MDSNTTYFGAEDECGPVTVWPFTAGWNRVVRKEGTLFAGGASREAGEAAGEIEGATMDLLQTIFANIEAWLANLLEDAKQQAGPIQWQ